MLECSPNGAQLGARGEGVRRGPPSALAPPVPRDGARRSGHLRRTDADLDRRPGVHGGGNTSRVRGGRRPTAGVPPPDGRRRRGRRRRHRPPDAPLHRGHGHHPRHPGVRRRPEWPAGRRAEQQHQLHLHAHQPRRRHDQDRHHRAPTRRRPRTAWPGCRRTRRARPSWPSTRATPSRSPRASTAPRHGLERGDHERPQRLRRGHPRRHRGGRGPLQRLHVGHGRRHGPGDDAGGHRHLPHHRGAAGDQLRHRQPGHDQQRHGLLPPHHPRLLVPDLELRHGRSRPANAFRHERPRGQHHPRA